MLHRHQNVLILATKQETAKTTLRIVKTIIKHCPKWLVPGITKISIDNRTSIELSNGSRIKALTTSDDVGRSEAVSILFCDEVAFIEKFEQIYTGLWPTLSTGGRAILASTPNGTGNWYHKCYEDARNNQNSFNCKFGTYKNPYNPLEEFNDRLAWWVHPNHDMDWFNKETHGKSPREISQEYLCAFNSSGQTFVDPETIQKLEDVATEPISREFFDKNLWIWKKPEKNATYLIACDVSSGTSIDYSAFVVLRLDTMEIVADYKSKIKPDVLGELLVDVAKQYNNAIIAPENNSGWSVPTVNKIQELNYVNLYYTSKKRSKFRTDYYNVDPYYAETSNDFAPGYSVTSVNRLPMLAKFEKYLRMRDVIVQSPRLLDEIKTFIIKDGGRPEALRGYNDDLIMALAGAIWVREESFLYAYKNSDMTDALIGGITLKQTTTNDNPKFNFNKTNIYDRGKVKEFDQKQKTIKLANGDVLDIAWLFKG